MILICNQCGTGYHGDLILSSRFCSVGCEAAWLGESPAVNHSDVIGRIPGVKVTRWRAARVHRITTAAGDPMDDTVLAREQT